MGIKAQKTKMIGSLLAVTTTFVIGYNLIFSKAITVHALEDISITVKDNVSLQDKESTDETYRINLENANKAMEILHKDHWNIDKFKPAQDAINKLPEGDENRIKLQKEYDVYWILRSIY
ncbi:MULTISPECIES: hypothetical protein [Clostridium]|uniref:Uncharacterized protein n=1 Tax=Clostridium cibarium TaxID=2762247 RepID=A0ABR8PVY7_9CLOT|nr:MULTISPECIES: hypothetical protein [Clostridium]MBD7912315.1 hypothetical protein [Clostridium cibarium]